MGLKFDEKTSKKKWAINVKRVNDKERQDIIECLDNKSLFKESERNLFLWKFGISTGLRVSDLVRIKRSDIENKTEFTIIEKKTGKTRIVNLNALLTDLIIYLNWMDKQNIKNPYIFYNKRNNQEHIKEDQVYKILMKVGDLLNINHLGTHSMRKTFAYNVFEQTKDIRLVMELLNHSNEKTTLRYIGIDAETQREKLKDVKFY